MKKTVSLILSLALLGGLMGCAGEVSSGDTAAPTGAASETQTPPAVTAAPDTEEFFSDGDGKDVTGETADAVITLEGSSGALSDSSRGSGGSEVRITSKGIYRVTGTSEGVKIIVDDAAKSGNVYLILDGVSMSGGDECILVENADKVILQCVGENTLASTDPDKGAVYAEDDLTVNGSGSLTVVSGRHGIVCKNDLKLTGASISVEAASIALKAGDSLRIRDSAVSLLSGHDGIQVDSDSGEGYFLLASGSVSIDAGYDGIDVGTSADTDFTGFLQVSGGSLSVLAGGGSGQSKSDTSQKGLKCDGNVILADGLLTVSSADDALHAGGSVSVTGGSLTLSSSDDGIHADDRLLISGGEITVLKSFEGLEAETISISGGVTKVTASDDGVNAAGGSDSSSAEWTPWGQGSSTGTLSISGGSLHVDAGGDGLDSNGSIEVSGGVTIVEGPVNGGNGALDKGDGQSCTLSITGGTVLALGTADMAENFDSGTQCAALVLLSGAAGDTVTVDDGSGFSFTVSKPFACAVYSSPYLKEGETYTITAGNNTASLDFSSGRYRSELGSFGFGFGGGLGGLGGHGGQGGGFGGDREGGARPGGFGGGQVPPDFGDGETTDFPGFGDEDASGA